MNSSMFRRPTGPVESLVTEVLTYRLTHPATAGDLFILDAMVKVDNGVCFLCDSLRARPSTELVVYQCIEYGEFSARPYLLGQAADRSTLNCVLGLYYDFCRRNSLNATELLVRAYPGHELAKDWDAVAWRTVLDAAQWQGTIFPDTWTEDAIQGLLVSLWDQGRTHLAAVLSLQLNLPTPSAASGGST